MNYDELLQYMHLIRQMFIATYASFYNSNICQYLILQNGMLNDQLYHYIDILCWIDVVDTMVCEEMFDVAHQLPLKRDLYLEDI